MPIHTIKLLPSTQAIQAVSAYTEQLEDDSFDFTALLISLKNTAFDQGFMIEQDNSHWASTHGRDYFYNPKLFAHAPLVYICVFLSETFKNKEIEEVSANLPAPVLKQALQRLTCFCH